MGLAYPHKEIIVVDDNSTDAHTSKPSLTLLAEKSC